MNEKRKEKEHRVGVQLPPLASEKIVRMTNKYGMSRAKITEVAILALPENSFFQVCQQIYEKADSNNEDVAN